MKKNHLITAVLGILMTLAFGMGTALASTGQDLCPNYPGDMVGSMQVQGHEFGRGRIIDPIDITWDATAGIYYVDIWFNTENWSNPKIAGLTFLGKTPVPPPYKLGLGGLSKDYDISSVPMGEVIGTNMYRFKVAPTDNFVTLNMPVYVTDAKGTWRSSPYAWGWAYYDDLAAAKSLPVLVNGKAIDIHVSGANAGYGKIKFGPGGNVEYR